MKRDLRLVVASPPDREQLVVELWQADEMCAEVSNETGEWVLEVYPKLAGGAWQFDYKDFLSAVTRARSTLLGS